VGLGRGALEGLVSQAEHAHAPSVSVILPTYNAAAFMRRALESALAQTVEDIEVIVIDNVSEDDSLSIAEAAGAVDPRVVPVRNARNIGAAASCNRALKGARGEWAAFLDADDWWAPERLERLLAVGNGADVVSDDLRVVRDSDAKNDQGGRSFLEHIGLRISAPRELTLLEFVRRDLGLLHPMVRRELVLRHGLGFDERFTIVNDFQLWVALLARGARWIQLPEGYYYYSRGPEAASSRQREMIKEVIESTALLVRDPALVPYPDVVAALHRRKREWEAHAAFATVRELVEQRKLADLARLLRRRPEYIALTLRRELRHTRLRLARRVRSPRRPSPPRLL
jgi:succinoglycan biosynthesis protein ExoO